MARVESELAARASERRKRQAVRWIVIIALAIGAIVLYNMFAGGDDDNEAGTTGQNAEGFVAEDSATSVAAATATTVPVVATTTTVDLRAPDQGECPPEDGSAEVTTQFDAPPPLCIDVDTFYAAEMNTSLGTMQIVLDPTRDTASVNNFVFLARNRAYEGVLFHRVIENFMVQGGDVEGLNGIGGPGYTFRGGNPQAGQYRVGSLAMANTGSDPSNNGAQFFIVTGPNGEALPPNFSLFGHVIEGIDVALEMHAVDTEASDLPTVDIVINSITITQATPDQVEAYNEAIG